MVGVASHLSSNGLKVYSKISLSLKYLLLYNCGSVYLHANVIRYLINKRNQRVNVDNSYIERKSLKVLPLIEKVKKKVGCRIWKRN